MTKDIHLVLGNKPSAENLYRAATYLQLKLEELLEQLEVCGQNRADEVVNNMSMLFEGLDIMDENSVSPDMIHKIIVEDSVETSSIPEASKKKIKRIYLKYRRILKKMDQYFSASLRY